MENNIGFGQQGWQCPVCHAVMSPYTSCCVNCTGYKSTTITVGDLANTNYIQGVIDKARENNSSEMPEV